MGNSSTLAALAAHTTPEVANRATDKDFSNSTDNVTGQWLYDRFLVNDEAETTKLGIVRHVVESVDTQTFKAALKDFVGLAEKENNPARLKTARNHQSVLRVAYGALKFCLGELHQAGYTTRTGYHEMAALGRQVLAVKGIKWDGSAALSEEQRAERKTENDRKSQERLLLKVMKEHGRYDGETLEQWAERCQSIGKQMIETEIANAEAEVIEKVSQTIIKENPDIAAKIAERILSLLMEEPAQ